MKGRTCRWWGRKGMRVETLAALGAVLGLPIAAMPQTIDLEFVGSTHPGFKIAGDMAWDWSGRRVSVAGDINGDGLDDLLVAAPDADVPVPPYGAGDAGTVFVVFGKSSQGTIDLSSLWSSAEGFRINGGVYASRVGFDAKGAGDVNGDGLADIVVGVPHIGKAVVVFGKSAAGTVSLPDIGMIGNTEGFVIDGIAGPWGIEGWSGVSGAGDVNGDGLADVIVGGNNLYGVSLSGASHLVFGKTSTDTVVVSDFGSPSSSGEGFTINGARYKETTGFSVSGAGDVNGDGLADVIIGGPSAINQYPASDPGQAYVVFGRTDDTTIELSNFGSLANTEGFRIDGVAAYDKLGFNVSGAGDVNGDGLADVVVGAPYADPTGGYSPQMGAGYVVFGKTDNATVEASLLGLPTNSWGFVVHGYKQFDRAGLCVGAAGDVDGDGLGDVLVAAPWADRDVVSHLNTGHTYLVWGRTAGDTIWPSDSAMFSTSGLIIAGYDPGELSGNGVAGFGDINGDGLSDMIIGAPWSDPNGVITCGQSYVVFSPVGLGAPASANYQAAVRAGSVGLAGVGAGPLGNDPSLPASSRLWVGFDSGNAATVSAALIRNDSGIIGIQPTELANVQWHLSSTRGGWSQANVAVRYTKAEIAGLDEASLVLHWAPTETGPFVPVSGHALDTARNRASGSLPSLPAVLVLVGTPGGSYDNGDANGDGMIDVADVTAIHNFVEGIIASLEGDGDINGDNDVTATDADLLVDQLVNGSSLP